MRPRRSKNANRVVRRYCLSGPSYAVMRAARYAVQKGRGKVVRVFAYPGVGVRGADPTDQGYGRAFIVVKTSRRKH